MMILSSLYHRHLDWCTWCSSIDFFIDWNLILSQSLSFWSRWISSHCWFLCQLVSWTMLWLLRNYFKWYLFYENFQFLFHKCKFGIVCKWNQLGRWFTINYYHGHFINSHLFLCNYVLSRYACQWWRRKGRIESK